MAPVCSSMVYNPYAKKRPRSDQEPVGPTSSSMTLNQIPQPASKSSSSSVYKPQINLVQGSYNVICDGAPGDAIAIRNTYRPKTQLEDEGTVVVAPPICVFQAKTIVNHENNHYNNIILQQTDGESVTTSNDRHVWHHSQVIDNTKPNSLVKDPAATTTANWRKPLPSNGKAGPAAASTAAPIMRMPSPNPYVKKQQQHHHSHNNPPGPSSQSNPQFNIAIPSNFPPKKPTQDSNSTIAISHLDSTASAVKTVGVASLRPASWTSNKNISSRHGTMSNFPATVVRGGTHLASGSAATQLPHRTATISLLQQQQQQQQHLPELSQHQTQHDNNPADTPMIGLPRELAYTPQDVKPIIDEYRLQLIQNANLSVPLRNGWTLYPHQKKAIVRSLTMRRMILALDMGLGKTLIGAVWAKAFKETFERLKIFVVCPVTLKEEWKRTAQEKVGLEVWAEGSLGKKQLKSNEKRSLVDDGLELKICSWAKVPTEVEPHVKHFVVCCDEAHSMQSTQAQRTKDVVSLVQDKRCVGVLLLTGTPMKNGKPSNLFPLLQAVRHPLGRHQKAYETHFCNGMLKNFGRGPMWDATGCSNLEQLKKLVASNLLHMTKEQCLNDLPPLTNVMYDVPVSSRFQIQYEKVVKELANIQANANNLNDEAVLGAVQRVRVVCAFAKVEAAVDLARTILNQEPAVVIFSSFAQAAKQVQDKLVNSGWPCELLTGETPQKKRQDMVDKFQNGLSSVFVCTFGAGGVGLTLTAASTVILLDRPWTPGETRQAEDRIRRIGQVKPCKSYWLRSFELDRQIDEALVSKNQTAEAVLNRNNTSGAIAGPAAKISINKLVHSFLLSRTRSQLQGRHTDYVT